MLPGQIENAIHLCLVGDEPTCNLTPAMDPGMRPHKAVFLHGPEHREHLHHLTTVLSRRGVKVSDLPVNNSWDIEHIRDVVMAFVEQNKDQPLLLNSTGGTKPMSMAAFEVFQAYDKPVFFVHRQDDKVVWLHPSDQPSHEIPDRIKLEEFLAGHGTEIVSIQQDNASRRTYRSLTENLIRHISDFAAPLNALNWLAGEASPSLRSPRLSGEQLGDRNLNEMIALFCDEGLCDLQNERLHFPSEEARFYVNGGWLEDHVFTTLLGMRKVLQVQDAAQGIKVTRTSLEGYPIHNELDVAFIANNHFYIVECKTKRFQDRKHLEGPGTEALYRLDTLADIIGGPRTSGALISYRSLSRWDRQRAQDLQIFTCEQEQVRQLGKHLKRWVLK